MYVSMGSDLSSFCEYIILYAFSRIFLRWTTDIVLELLGLLVYANCKSIRFKVRLGEIRAFRFARTVSYYGLLELRTFLERGQLTRVTKSSYRQVTYMNNVALV